MLCFEPHYYFHPQSAQTQSRAVGCNDDNLSTEPSSRSIMETPREKKEGILSGVIVLSGTVARSALGLCCSKRVKGPLK